MKASGRWFVRTAGKTPALSCMAQVSRQSSTRGGDGLLVDVLGERLIHTFHIHLWGAEPPSDTQEKQFDIEMSEREMRSLYEKIGNALDGIRPQSVEKKEPSP